MSAAATSSAITPALERPQPTLAEISAFVREALARAPSPALRSIVVPLPRRFDALAILGGLRAVDAWYLRGSELELCGLGVTRRIEASGDDRWARAKEAIEAFARVATVLRHPAVSERIEALRGPSARAFVGAAFQTGDRPSPRFRHFPDALVVLPRWTLMQPSAGGPGALELTVEGEAPPHPDAVVAELEELLSVERPMLRAPGAMSVRHEPEASHRARVERALADIERGHLEKVVVSRATTVHATSDIDPIATLKRLGERSTEGTVYFVRQAGTVFTGVTPERLVAVHDRAVQTVALAGTALAGDEGALLGSDKDRHEHQVVVRSIEEALAPLTKRLTIAERPTVARAGSVLHLKTTIEGVLHEGVGALDVAAALHPTPAVGGTPRAAARAWIAEHEPDRGWYGAPLGWADGHGNGELSVALRGGLIAGPCAWAFAGGGIVRGSRPDLERDEAALKVNGFLRALGVGA